MVCLFLGAKGSQVLIPTFVKLQTQRMLKRYLPDGAPSTASEWASHDFLKMSYSARTRGTLTFLFLTFAPAQLWSGHIVTLKGRRKIEAGETPAEGRGPTTPQWLRPFYCHPLYREQRALLFLFSQFRRPQMIFYVICAPIFALIINFIPSYIIIVVPW